MAGGKKITRLSSGEKVRKNAAFSEKDFPLDDLSKLILALDEDVLEERLKHLNSLGEIGDAKHILLSLIRDADNRERKRLAVDLTLLDVELDKIWPKLNNSKQRVKYLLNQVSLSISPELPTDSPAELRPNEAKCDQLAEEYEAQQRELTQKFIKRLLPILKNEIQTRNPDTYEQKLDLVRWINGELKRFDLAIKSPVTGRAAVLSADSTAKQGRYKIKGDDDQNNMITTNISKNIQLIETIDLIEAPLRREPLKEWREKIGHPGGGRKRV